MGKILFYRICVVGICMDIRLRCDHIYHYSVNFQPTDQQKAAWFESDFCVSCASCIYTLLTIYNIPFLHKLQNVANVSFEKKNSICWLGMFWIMVAGLDQFKPAHDQPWTRLHQLKTATML